MKIAIDAMGGDYAPEEVVKGAVSALEERDLEIILLGDIEKVKEESKKYKYNRLGWMTEKRIKISGLAEKVINFFHDRQGNLSRIVYPSGTVVDNRYNNRGLLKTISTVSGGGDIPNEE